MDNQHLKHGDLCLIVRCTSVPENVGKSVTLMEFIPKGEGYIGNGVRFFNAPFDAWIVQGEGLKSRRGPNDTIVDSNIVGISQRSLMKINGKDEDRPFIERVDQSPGLRISVT